MNYQLSSEEMAQVRRMVQLLCNASRVGVLSVEAEAEACALAEKIKEWLK